MRSPVVHYMLQPSGGGYLQPDWYGAEPRRHCVSVTHTKKKKWSLSMKHWRNAVRKTPCFTKMKWIFTSIPKLAQTGSYVGSKSAWSRPGQNEKYYLAGALHSGTGKVSYVGGNSKSSSLFSSLLKHMKATYRRAKTITLIVDNYIIHKSRETLRWLKANPKFRVIYQPVYSPWVNHVERLWQALHETITRNHQCRSMWQLLKKVRHFMDTVSPFPG